MADPLSFLGPNDYHSVINDCKTYAEGAAVLGGSSAKDRVLDTLFAELTKRFGPDVGWALWLDVLDNVQAHFIGGRTKRTRTVFVLTKEFLVIEAELRHALDRYDSGQQTDSTPDITINHNFHKVHNFYEFNEYNTRNDLHQNLVVNVAQSGNDDSA